MNSARGLLEEAVIAAPEVVETANPSKDTKIGDQEKRSSSRFGSKANKSIRIPKLFSDDSEEGMDIFAKDASNQLSYEKMC
mgnify:CR=1 FL=1|jgi:hypothetical protein